MFYNISPKFVTLDKIPRKLKDIETGRGVALFDPLLTAEEKNAKVFCGIVSLTRCFT